MAAAAEVEIRLDGEPTAVTADGRRIEQVIRNLLANAITYASAGGHVAVVTWKQEGSAYRSVRDDGPGVSEAVCSRVFDRFFRADEARSGNGAGLGLAICRELVIAHGGSIEATSELGKGSAFTLAIPGPWGTGGPEREGAARRRPLHVVLTPSLRTRAPRCPVSVSGASFASETSGAEVSTAVDTPVSAFAPLPLEDAAATPPRLAPVTTSAAAARVMVLLICIFVHLLPSHHPECAKPVMSSR